MANYLHVSSDTNVNLAQAVGQQEDYDQQI